MRILMLSQFYPPVIGGEEQHVRNLSAALAAQGHEVTVGTLAQPDQPAFVQDGAVRVHRIPATTQRAAQMLYSTGRTFAPPLPDPETVNAIAAIIRRERPQVVHAHNWIVHSFIPLKRWSGARLVLTLHDYSLRCAKKRLMYQIPFVVVQGLPSASRVHGRITGPRLGCLRFSANWTMGHAERATVDFFAPVSQAVADGNSLTGTELPFEVIPNFVPDSASELPAREAVEPYLAQLPEGDYLLFVGDLTREKGIDVLLEAYACLKNAPPLVCIGRPRDETPKVLPTGVRVLQNWPHDAVLWAWSRSLIGLVPSVWPDPCPTVAMEAMAASKPVVAARSGGLPDIVADGETGFIVPPGDAQALCGAIARLLADSELRIRMGEAGKERVRSFQAQSVVERLEAVYTRLLVG